MCQGRQSNPEDYGYTTLVAALVVESQVILANVGDTRAYRLRDGKLQQATEDDCQPEDVVRSVAEERQRARDAIVGCTFRHLTRAIGWQADLEVPVLEESLRRQDQYLLCSDGLHAMASEADIEQVLASAGDLETALGSLIQLARDGGGKDNISAVLLRCR